MERINIMIKIGNTPSFSEIIKMAMGNVALDIHVSIPGKIIKYDKDTQKASVAPLLQKKFNNTAGTVVDMPILNGVPVHHLSCNRRNTFIHIPIKVGDLGMIMFCDRAIDNYLSSSPQEGEDVKTIFHNNRRYHDLSDAWFIPGILPFSIALQDTSNDDIVIKNENTKINIKPDGTITIDNGTNELIETLSTLIDNLINARILTLMGPQPFIADTLAKLINDKLKIDSFKE
jgi:hypothetical protein